MPITDKYGTTFTYDPLVRWEIDGVPIEMAGTQVEFTWDEDVKEHKTIGARVINVRTLYGDSPRVTGLCSIKVTFPRLSKDMILMFRRYREFGRSLRLKMHLLDPDDTVLCQRDKCPQTGLPRFWAPHRWVCDDTNWKVYTRSTLDAAPAWVEATTVTWDKVPREGYVRWRTPIPSTTQVGMRYVWEPVVRVFEIAPGDFPGQDYSVYKPQITFREVD